MMSTKGAACSRLWQAAAGCRRLPQATSFIEAGFRPEFEMLHHPLLLIQPQLGSSGLLWEVFLLKKIGFGLELSKCALTNQTKNLRYISPKSGCAVSDKVSEQWKSRLFILPKFLISENKATLQDIKNGIKITTYFLKKFSISINKILPFTRDDFIDRIFNI